MDVSVNGLDLFRKLREKSRLPAVFLTAPASDADELLGVDASIDQTPSRRRLVELAKAVLRRCVQHDGGAADDLTHFLICGKLRLDPDRRASFWDNKYVHLTATEFAIVKELALRPGFDKSREALRAAVYDDPQDVQERTIDKHINRINAAFKAVDHEFNAIEVVRNVGYRLRKT